MRAVVLNTVNSKSKLILAPTVPTLIAPYVCFLARYSLLLNMLLKKKKLAIEEQEQLPSELLPFKKATFKIVIVQQVPEKITSQRSTLLKARQGYQKDDTSTSCY